MNIDWEQIYSKDLKKENFVDFWVSPNIKHIEFKTVHAMSESGSKFNVPIKPPPWSEHFQENVDVTLDWLTRDSRKIRFSEEFIHKHIREFWYHNKFMEGTYTHVCYPQDLLVFRTQYEAIYNNLYRISASKMSSTAIGYTNNCKQLLWKQWHCFGREGMINHASGKIDHDYTCSKCGELMPKGVKMFTILTQSKLKDA